MNCDRLLEGERLGSAKPGMGGLASLQRGPWVDS